MRLGISEILKLVDEAKTHKEKLAIIEKHNSKVLYEVLTYTFNPNIQFDLPPGDPPYKENQNVDSRNMLYSEWRRMYLFVKDDPRSAHLSPEKRQDLFIGMLEALDKDDAKLLIGIKNKKLPYNNVRRDVLKKAYPGFLENV